MTHILLVDDDPMILLAAGYALRAGGYDVTEAPDVAAALRAALDRPPDAVVSDVQLADGEGTALLARLRAEPATRAVPVVFLTAATAPGEVGRLTSLGACGVIPKPFDPTTLADQIRRLLRA